MRRFLILGGGLLFLFLLIGGFLLKRVSKLEKSLQKGGEKVIMEEGKLKVLMIVAPVNFRDEEYQKPREVLESAGWKVEVASKGVKEAQGMLGARVSIDKELSEINLDEYEGVIFVGGSGTTVYFEDQLVLNLAKSAYEKGKVIGAICIAPSILANAGILQGKNATAYSSEEENLKAKGVKYTKSGVIVDGKIVTASGPQVAYEFGEKLVEVLGQ
ncbi:MAG: DJ-1/PfpI family protein [Microgenomates group bacterium]